MAIKFRILPVLLGFTLLLGSQPDACAQGNGVLREVWLDIPGGTVADLTNHAAFPHSPSFDEILTEGFEAPTDQFDAYGQRLRALLIPPTTGNYRFRISSDDASQLYLSTDATPENRQLIAWVSGWTPPRSYRVESSQRSGNRWLVAGQRYYIEALMKEGWGGDNLCVTWQRPLTTDPSDGSPPIPNANLIPFGVGPPVFTAQPTNLTVIEGGTAVFSVALARASGAEFQWYRNGAPMSGATLATLGLPGVGGADSGSSFYCRAVNAFGATNSSSAVLTVLADTIPPTLVYALCPGDLTLVTVGFSEMVDPVTASVAGNYTLNHGVQVQSATLLDDGATVVLRTPPLSWGLTYTLTVNNVRDRALNPNVIAPNSQRTFAVSYTPLPIHYVRGTNEPPGPSSRRTGLAITEIMYNPAPRADGRNLEFIELFNSNPWAEDLSGHRLAGDVDYTFPPGTMIGALGYRVIAANPADVQAVHGLAGVLGPLANASSGSTSNSLSNGGATVRLLDELGSVLLELAYDDEPPWPVAADGTGHSLVLARPSYGEGDPRAWEASDRVGGSPGAFDAPTFNPYRTVLINELLAHTDLPLVDYVELFNYGSVAVNLGDCVLTDNPATNRFRIPAGTAIQAGGHLVFTETELGFALGSAGETVYLLSPTGDRVLDVLLFGGQENGVAYGRSPDGAPHFRRLAERTPGAPNASPLAPLVVINELHYNSITGDQSEEFVELFNSGAEPVDLSGWRLSDGISFTFPDGRMLPAGGHVVVAKNANRLLAAHDGLSPTLVLGNFGGQLSNSGERIALEMPDEIVSTNAAGARITNTIHIVVDEVTYGTGGRWGSWSDGGGSSLERVETRGDGRLAPHWADSDETAKSGWTTVEFTGRLDHGAMAQPSQLQLFLQGEGECLVDNLEVIPQAGGNLVANGTFDSNADGWFFQGTHEDSRWVPTGGYSGGALHVIATHRGDPGANRIRTVLTGTVPTGTIATLRARVRWLKGHPELMLRLHGNWLEAAGPTLTTRAFGTPGAPNTRFRANSGPAITDVRHAPVLPLVGQPVTVTAQIEDPDGIASVLLWYRVDPSTNWLSLPMAFRGAGFFASVIPGQPANTRVAFYLEASDAATPTGVSRFPANAPARECLVGFGETLVGGNFANYRLWMSQRNVNRWIAREKQSNRGLDATFVLGTTRVVYNAETLYSGSPFHTPGYSGPLGSLCDYVLNVPPDDLILGSKDLLLHTIGNQGSDPTYQAERAAFWIGRKLGVPYLNRRYIRVIFNGQQRSVVYEDTQQPNRDLVRQFFAEDDGGPLHKIEDWFEFNDSGDNRLGNVDATLQNFTTDGGMKKTARYRWNWRPRAVRESANDFSRLFTLVDAMNASDTATYRAQVAGLVDVEQWMRVLATERIVGNWDSYGYNRGKNMYAYQPLAGRWALLPWDIDFVMTSGGDGPTTALFGGNEPVINTFRAFPEFQRAYWRAFEDAVNGPLEPATFAAQVDPRFSALTANSVNPVSPQTLKDYAASRRNYLLGQLANVASPFTVSPTVTLSNGLGVVTGTAPVGVASLAFNGMTWNVNWTSVSNWVALVPLQTGSNFFSITGLDRLGQPVSGASNGVSRIYAPAVPSPVDVVVFNEIMFRPPVPEAQYVELFNTSFTQAFDLSGWRINGLGYWFPGGSFIAPRGHLVLTRNRTAFSVAYGPNILVFDEYPGNLQDNGETLTLFQPVDGGEVVVDRVRYGPAPPWAPTAPGIALQLRDPTQDNSRVANWAVGLSTNLPAQSIPLLAFTNHWHFMQVSNLDAVAWTAPGFNDAPWPSGPGLLAFEDNNAILPLVGTVLKDPRITTNGLPSGHAYYFRTTVNVTSDLSGFTINASAYVDDGAVFHVNGVEVHRLRMNAGAANHNTLANSLPPGGDATIADEFTIPAAAFQPGLNVIAVQVHQNSTTSSDITFGLRLTAEFAGGSISQALLTPGAPNSVAATLPAFPSLWLNELQADNVSGPLDNFGQREPWVELHNSGTNDLNLGGYYLSDSYTNLTRWAFPANAIVPAGGFLVVWCDAQPAQSTPTAPHANFRLSSGSGQVALSRALGTGAQLVDYLNYNNLPSNWSYGNFPDAQPFYRRQMFAFSPGATNRDTAQPITIFINEWLADNATGLRNESGSYADWFELYNSGTNEVHLGGYFLTDNLNNKFKFGIPNNGHYVVPPGGFLLVWADNSPGLNSTNHPDLHVGFALSRDGEALGLFAPDGTQVDALTFGPQTTDVSEGRYPDGSALIQAMTIPTPRAPNRLPNTPPILAPIPPQEVTLGQTLEFIASATDDDFPPQQLLYTLGPDAPPGATINAITGHFHWTPSNAPALLSVSVIVTDDGLPSLSASRLVPITVHLPPTISAQVVGDLMLLSWPRGILQEAVNADGPYVDIPATSPFPVDISEGSRFYRVRLP